MKQVYFESYSWKYPSWENLVYSSRSPGNFLKKYSRTYQTVEVDQWFWSLGKESYGLPNRKVVAEYDESIPQDFKFTI